MEFKNIIGNTEVKDYLSKSIKQNNILHSYLFLGKEGIGKLLIAKEFAKAILCLNEDKNDECTCKSCTCFNGNNNPDFHIINEAGETIKIAENVYTVSVETTAKYEANEDELIVKAERFLNNVILKWSFTEGFTYKIERGVNSDSLEIISEEVTEKIFTDILDSNEQNAYYNRKGK